MSRQPKTYSAEELKKRLMEPPKPLQPLDDPRSNEELEKFLRRQALIHAARFAARAQSDEQIESASRLTKDALAIQANAPKAQQDMPDFVIRVQPDGVDDDRADSDPEELVVSAEPAPAERSTH